MRKLFIVFFIFAVSSAFAIDQSNTITRAQFEDLIIQSGGVNINNFSIREDTSFMDRNLRVIRVSFSARNRNEAARNFGISLVGLDASGNLIWSMNLEPLLGSISGNRTEQVSGSAFVPQGTLNRTQRIWYRIVGNI